MAILSSILVAAALQALSTAPGLPGPETAARQVAACGFATVQQKFDDSLQETILEIGDTNATDTQLKCAAEISLSVDYLVLMSSSLQARYGAIYSRIIESSDVAISRRTLAAQGRALPPFKKGDDYNFAMQLQAFCGEGAKGALESRLGPHTISQRWLTLAGEEQGAPAGEVLRCLLNAASATGFALGFVGNEVHPTSQGSTDS